MLGWNFPRLLDQWDFRGAAHAPGDGTPKDKNVLRWGNRRPLLDKGGLEGGYVPLYPPRRSAPPLQGRGSLGEFQTSKMPLSRN
jgi:hypothetical protein